MNNVEKTKPIVGEICIVGADMYVAIHTEDCDCLEEPYFDEDALKDD